MSTQTPPYLLHTETDTVYPYNELMARHEGMEPCSVAKKAAITKKLAAEAEKPEAEKPEAEKPAAPVGAGAK